MCRFRCTQIPGLVLRLMSGSARVTLPFAVAVALAVGVASGWWLGGGEQRDAAADEETWLFSHTADSGEIRQRSDGSLELALRSFDENVTAFTDRPFRDAKIESVEWLVSSWNELFAESPPNAVLVEHDPDGAARSVVVELSSPQVSGGELTYAITVLESVPEGRLSRVAGMSYENPVRAFGAVSLFIDDVTLSCAEGGECRVGDIGPGGGVVRFVQPNWRGPFASPGSDCFNTCWYLEVALRDQSQEARWCSADFLQTFLGVTSTGIGDGMANTIAADATCTSGAIQIAADYSNNGKTDWHLPSRDELMAVSPGYCGSWLPPPNFSCETYWSSSEESNYNAWFVNFGAKNSYPDDKPRPLYVRLVRAF